MLDQANEDRFLSRQQLVDELTAAGLPIALATLKSMAVRGGGPAFHKFGRRVVYRWADARSWANARLGKPVHSTSELAA